MSVEIICEVGCNHNGNLRTAFDLADVAKKAGADAIKFQTWFRTDFTHVPFQPWTREMWKDLFTYCDMIGMPWFSTPFDLEAVAFLKECGMKVWKVPSGMITNKEYLAGVKAAAGEDQVIVSTGMAAPEEIEAARAFFGRAEFLTCTSLYPALPLEIDLSRLLDGFSDHSEGDELAIAAVALGAKIIEKHLTLDRSQPGPDHKASLSPTQFADMVRKIRNVEEALKPKPMSEREYAQRDLIRERMAFR